MKVFAFENVASEEWLVNSNYRELSFESQDIRFVKIEILNAVGENVILAELNLGSSFERPQLVY